MTTSDWIPQSTPEANPTAVVKNLFRYLEVKISDLTIDTQLPLTPNYPSLGALKRFLDDWDFETLGAKITPEQLDQVTYPALAFMHDGQFILLTAYEADQVTFLHPGAGWRRVSLEAFRLDWSGYFLMAMPGVQSAEVDFDQRQAASARQLTGWAWDDISTLFSSNGACRRLDIEDLPDTNRSIETFQSQRFAVVRNRLRRDVVNDAVSFYNAMSPYLDNDDGQCERALYSYGNAFTEALLACMLPDIEAHTGLSLYPTYSYSRVYYNGSSLARHIDRDACEITVTVPLQIDEASPWPIHLLSDEIGQIDIQLEIGDYLIFRGGVLPHWREVYQGERQVQAFLHYVDQHGPYAHHKYDGRHQLGDPTVRQHQRRAVSA